MIRFEEPWLLLLLPLALLPLLLRDGQPLRNAWIAFAPRDRASALLGWLLRALAALAIAALVFALADPFRPEYTVERTGRGAEIVLVLDRSRSMDQGFAPGTKLPKGINPTGPEALSHYFAQAPARLRESKGKVARQLLAEFTEKRPQDRFALVVFSTLPMRVLDFTSRAEMVRAAIEAGNIGRGLSETNVGRAIEAAVSMWEDRPYTGSRILLLVSDGGDRLDPDTREHLAFLLRKQRVAIYWLYLRSANSPGLTFAEGDSDAAAESVPEKLMHRFFESLETPYRAYEAGTSEALQQAIADVNRLENLPITTQELVPRRELAPWAEGLALACVLLLLAARSQEMKRWA